jgi:hypothetical protein
MSLPILISPLYQHFDTFLQVTEITVICLYQSVMQIPLQELYRYSPWFLGWEGGSLLQICARITYRGDEAVWSRNWSAAKEEAWSRLT